MMDFGYPEPTSAAEMFERYDAVRHRLGAQPRRTRLTAVSVPPRALPSPNSVVRPVETDCEDFVEQEVIYLLPPPTRTELEKIQAIAWRYRHLTTSAPWRKKALIIQELVAAEFKVSIDDLLRDDRHAPLSRIRMIAMSLAVHLANYGITTVGHHFRRDHTTVYHADKKMKPLVEQALAAA